MAQAVVDVMQQQLGGWVVGPLLPQHVLCVVCPGSGGVGGAAALHKGVWSAVCLAAVNAMDLGRRAANKARVEQREALAAQQQQQQQRAAPPDQRLVSQLLQPAALTAAQQQHQDQVRQRQQVRVQQELQQQQAAAAARLEEVKQQAVSRFWELLQDFVALSVAPASWLGDPSGQGPPGVPPHHPFMRVVGRQLSVYRVNAGAQGGG